MEDNPLSRISPIHWDHSVLLHADRIDAYRRQGVRHPAYRDGGLLFAMRYEYDRFCERWYMQEPTEEEAHEAVHENTSWYHAMAIMALDYANYLGYDYEMPTCESLYPLLRKKQEDYGYANHSRFGRNGLIVRLHDKVSRLENLMNTSELGENDGIPNYESVVDTLSDIVGYSIIGCLLEADEWELPLTEDPLPILPSQQ